MIRTFALGSAAADLTAAVLAISEHGLAESACLALWTATSILLTLGGASAIYRCFADQQLPEVVTIEDLEAEQPAARR